MTDSRVRARAQLPWLAIVVATLVAASLDAAFAFVTYVLVDGRYNFETLLQYIASGVAGHSAFASGGAGVGYAALGFGIHTVIALAFVLAYVLVVPHLPERFRGLSAGTAYGAGIWVFMNAVVLPLGRSTQEAFLNGFYLAFLVDHALFVGLPIAWVLNRWPAGTHEPGHRR